MEKEGWEEQEETNQSTGEGKEQEETTQSMEAVTRQPKEVVPRQPKKAAAPRLTAVVSSRPKDSMPPLWR